ncbi:protein-L-isoaspartate(D-aspartate) O-methyltransferase isoform X1 [Lates japonicus]|uniref:Protein-L-isoaspartate(D-aspartate) O-methyltransferase isoform X1 n=1 Tax=Lates japonicus TaxID=270547 RepID=A0AAD3RJC9_LATJO|nr:protein-L-isoaspartate(D-aspartate) O-methyltransferase isoform X1 [Lates japonicus]
MDGAKALDVGSGSGILSVCFARMKDDPSLITPAESANSGRRADGLYGGGALRCHPCWCGSTHCPPSSPGPVEARRPTDSPRCPAGGNQMLEQYDKMEDGSTKMKPLMGWQRDEL